MRRLRTPLILLVGLILMLLLQSRTDELRRGLGPVNATAVRGMAPGAAAAALGGLRTPVLVALWIEADHLWREKRWWALPSRYELIVRLEPRIQSAWGLVADRLILNLPSRTPDPDQKWAWTRLGLSMLDRGLAANPDSYWLRLQRWIRLVGSLGGDPEMCARFEDWRGWTLETEALRHATDLEARYPDDPFESTRVAQTLKAFAFLEFERAYATFAETPDSAREGYRRAEIRWRAVADAYRKYETDQTGFIRYAETFASLSADLTRVSTLEQRARLVYEKLVEFRDYGEAEKALGWR